MDGLICGCSLQRHREENTWRNSQQAWMATSTFPFRTAQWPHNSEKHPFKQRPTLSKKDNVSPAQTKSAYFPAHLSLCSFKIKSQALPTQRPTKQKCILCTHVRERWQGCQMFGSRSVTGHHTALNNR